MSDTRVCFCLAGWHFGGTVVEQLAGYREADTYVVSHRTPDQVSPQISDSIDRENLLFRPNLGYDWGCYQQFVSTGLWREYDVLFFMHDDLIITDLGFVQSVVGLLRRENKVVGNGRNSILRDWPRQQPYSYAHSRWIPPGLEFQHDTVRGSFFALTADSLARFGDFEVFWDPFAISVGWGNRSLIASSGKMQYTFGDDCFAFLSEEYLVSSYITEMERGGAKVNPEPLIPRYAQSKLFIPAYRWLGTKLVERRMAARQEEWNPDPVTRLLASIIARFSGVAGILAQENK